VRAGDGRRTTVGLEAGDLGDDGVYVLITYRVARRARGADLGAGAGERLAAEEPEDRADLRQIEDGAEVDVERIVAGAREDAAFAVHERADRRGRRGLDEVLLVRLTGGKLVDDGIGRGADVGRRYLQVLSDDGRFTLFDLGDGVGLCE